MRTRRLRTMDDDRRTTSRRTPPIAKGHLSDLGELKRLVKLIHEISMLECLQTSQTGIHDISMLSCSQTWPTGYCEEYWNQSWAILIPRWLMMCNLSVTFSSYLSFSTDRWMICRSFLKKKYLLVLTWKIRNSVRILYSYRVLNCFYPFWRLNFSNKKKLYRFRIWGYGYELCHNQ